jgi:RNA polymerase sigma-70 factor, ECF subfamily
LEHLNEDIWVSIQEGDEKAFESIFHKFYAGLCSYSYHIIQSNELSEEVVQDFFLKIWMNRKEITINGSIQAYLYKSIHNLSINKSKQQSIKKFKMNKLTDETVWRFIENTYTVDDFVIEKLEAQETEETINKIISELPAQCREIFMLSRFEGKSNDEIAGIFKISINSVRTQLYRALSRIKDALEK